MMCPRPVKALLLFICWVPQFSVLYPDMHFVRKTHNYIIRAQNAWPKRPGILYCLLLQVGVDQFPGCLCSVAESPYCHTTDILGSHHIQLHSDGFRILQPDLIFTLPEVHSA